MTPFEKVAELLINQRLTVAVAESCTGGLLCSKMTDVPGSSAFMKLGVVTYSNEAKVKMLNVPQETIEKYGAVSEQTAVAMAKGVRAIHSTDFGMALTGIAGPTGGSKSKPVGLVYLAISTKNESLCLKCQFKGERRKIKTQAAVQAITILLEFL